MWPKAIEYLETCRDESESQTVLAFQQTQVGYLGGRILPPDCKSPTWRVQVFHDAEGLENGTWLPDGCKLVILPPAIQKICGLVTR